MLLIDDNFLTSEEIKSFEDLLCNNLTFPWFFYQTANKKGGSLGALNLDGFNNNMQFIHTGMYDGKPITPLANEGMALLQKFTDKHKILIDSVLRIKANLILKKNGDYPSKNTPHVDLISDLLPRGLSGIPYVFLYYVNDSDGDTYLFNEKFEDGSTPTLTLLESVTPKAGRAILFEVDRYHSSSTPEISGFRCVININFMGTLKS